MKTFHLREAEQREKIGAIIKDVAKKYTDLSSLMCTVDQDVEIMADDGEVYYLEARKTQVWFLPLRTKPTSNVIKKNARGRIMYDLSTMYVALDPVRLQLAIIPD